MRKQHDERGVTLVELIAAMALAGIVVVIIMTMFSIGSKHSALESRNLNLQQEMNLIITKLSQNHRQGDCYSLVSSDNQLRALNYIRSESDGECTASQDHPPYEVVSEGLNYKICRMDLSGSECTEMPVVDPELDDLRISVTLEDDQGRSLSQTTTLTRIKVGEFDEES